MPSVMFFVVLFVSVGVFTFNAEAGAPKCPSANDDTSILLQDKDCSKYWRCLNGNADLLECPNGLYFNKKTNSCDSPHKALCSEDESSEELDSDEIEDILKYDNNIYRTCNTSEIHCPAEDDEQPVYFPLPNCTQFCQCSNGVPYLHDCPADLHFNPALNVCDNPQNAGCANGNSTDDSSTTSTESSGDDKNNSATTTKKGGPTIENDESYELCPDTVTNECPAVDGEHPVYIPLPNCSQFCHCSNGLPYLHNCPDDLHFNPVLKVCDRPEDAGCARGNDVISTTEGTGGDDNQPSPTTESSESNETDKATTTEKSATTTGSDESYELCHDTITNECPAVDGEHPVYIPLPNCSQFCQCSNGLPYLHNCPDGLHFNPVLNVCDWPEDAGCAGGNDVISTTEGTGGDDNQPSPTMESSEGTETDKATTEKGVTTTDSDESYELCPDPVTNECPAVDGEHPVYISLPNCSQFCQCSNGLPYLHNCPDDLHFNPVLNVCDWPGDAGCAGGNDVISTTEGTGGDDNQPSPTTESSEGNETDKATTEKSVTTTDSDESYELCPDTVTNECPAVDGEHPVYISLPNCSQFCQCSNGLPYLHNCPDDLHFNPVLNVCDWPGDAGCAGGNDVISTTEGTGGEDTQPSPTTESSEGNETDKATTEKSVTTTDSDESYELCPDTVTNECPAVDGEHPVYIPLPNCSQFCQCSNGLPYLHNCPDGLHFNPVLNVCDWPGDAGCAGGNDVISTTEGTGGDDNQPSPTTESSESNETDKATTTEKSATTTDSDESYELCPDTVTNECPEVDGEHPVYIPLPNCSQFCQCSNGLPYLHNCPDDLHFNPVLNVCDWPGDAGCAGGNDVISTTEGTGGEDTQPSPTTESSESNETDKATTTEKSATTTGSDESYELCHDTITNECPEVDGEHPVYIPLPNCSQFCQCSNGLPYLHNCPDDLHFNPVLNVCDWPGDAGCAGGNDVISTTEGTGGEDTQPYPTTESSESNETDKATTTEKSATTTGSDESYELCPDTVTNECPAVDGEHPVYIPLPNCSQFCQCSNGLPYLHNCPDGLHFNPVLNVCDWPGDAGCAGGNDVISTTEGTGGDDNQPSPTTESSESRETDKATTTEKSATTTDSDESYELCPDTVTNECPAVDGEHPVYIPLPNCSQFCQCSNGLPYLHNCPDGLHFNPVLNVCDWPGDAGCAGGNDVISTTEGTGGDDNQPSPTTESSESRETDKATTTEKSATTTDSDESYELCPDTVTNECPAVDGEHPVYIPLPNCSQFCQCSNGLPYLHNCPDGLHFNPVLNVCDWPGDAGCAGGNDVISTTEGTGGDDNQPSPTTESSESNETDKATTTEKSATTTGSDESYELCHDTITNECPAVDGEHPVYIPLPNCSQFCQCSNGLPYLHNCPDGLHFNPVLNVCDLPGDAGCAGGNDVISTTEGTGGDDNQPSPTTESSEGNETDKATTEKSVTTTDSDESYELCPDTVTNECPAVDGEHPVYISLPNCSQFCQCSNGLPYLHNCPDGLHFNPVLNVCDWPGDAGCAGGNDVISTTEGTGGDDNQPSPTTESSEGNETDKATTEKSVTTTDSDESYELCPDTVTNECPAVDGEHPVYISLPNCSQFCQCSNGLPYLHNCPDGLHFNPVLNVCDWPGDASCAGGNDVISTTEGTGGDDNQPSPTTESSESNETDKATTTEKSATTTDSDESYELCPDTVTNECPAVDGEHPVYIPLPNCSQFCQCSNGLPYLHNCPDGLHFNPVLNVCDWPGDAGCAGGNDVISTTEGTGGDDNQPSPTTESSESRETDKATTTEKSATTTDSDESYELCPDTVTNECPAVDGEHPVYIPLPNCSQFCQCSNGLPYLHNCPDGLHFNPVLNVCDWPEDAGCAGGNDVISTTEGTGGEDTQPSPTTESSEGNETDKATTEKSVTTTDSDESYELCPDTVTNECPAVDGEHPIYIPLPNCSQFCQCSNGLPYLHNCPDGLHFNPVLNVCDWPGDAGCAGGNDVISTTEGTGGDDNQPSPTTESNESNETDKATTTEKSATTTDSDESYELCPDTVTNECPEVDGEHPVYIPLPNCSQFCQCSNGLPYLHNCPDDLHFNPVLNVCDWPGDAGCAGGNDVISTTEGTGGEDTQPSPTTESGESNETDKATTTEKSATTTDSGESYELCPDTVTNECPAVDGEHPVYIPLPNCSQFCQCSNRLPYLHNCPDGLHFNPVLNVCDWPGDAGCAGGNDVISTTEGTGGDDNQPSPTTESSESNETDKATTTEKSATTTDSDESYELCPDTVTNECPAVDGEHAVYIPLPNCSQFCQCSNGLPYLHNCPDGLHFNPVLNVCDWPGDAGCAGGNDVISTTEGTGGDDNQPSPTTESSESNETDKATTTEKSATTTDSDESYELCPDTVTNECPAVDGEHAVYIPLPNCSQFCQCSNGLPYLHNCPDGLHFNPVLNVCDWPGDAGCAGGNDVISTTEGTGGDDNQPSPTTESSESNETDKATTTEKSATTTGSDESYELCHDTITNECPAVDGEHPVYIPLPNCSQFCQCSNGLPYLHNCPDGLHFNPVLNVCDWPGDAGCAGGNDVISTTEGTGGEDTQPSPTTDSSGGDESDFGTTTEDSVSTTVSEYMLCLDTVENKCPAVDGEHPVYIPLPNCTQFCQCSNGLPYLHYCPSDLHFNPVLNVCDYKENAGCASNNGTYSTLTTVDPGNKNTDASATTERSEDQETDRPVTTKSSTSTTESAETIELCPDTVENVCPPVDGEYPVYMPLPNCAQFCQCSNGLPYLHNCSDGLHFNALLNVCDYPQSAQCDSIPS